MRLNENSSRLRVGKHYSDMKQGEVLSSLLFNCVLNYAITRVQVIQDGLKLNGKHQVLVYADEVNILS